MGNAWIPVRSLLGTVRLHVVAQVLKKAVVDPLMVQVAKRGFNPSPHNASLATPSLLFKL